MRIGKVGNEEVYFLAGSIYLKKEREKAFQPLHAISDYFQKINLTLDKCDNQTHDSSIKTEKLIDRLSAYKPYRQTSHHHSGKIAEQSARNGAARLFDFD